LPGSGIHECIRTCGGSNFQPAGLIGLTYATPRLLKNGLSAPVPVPRQFVTTVEPALWFFAVGACLSNALVREVVLSGAGTSPLRMFSNDSNLPYKILVASPSGLTTAPLRLTPANTPRAREYVRIWARIFQSVPPATCLPTGPAAADASAPILNLLERRLRTPFSFMMSMTRSTACAPICNPQLPPAIR
jgi:hypothetical protein